MNAEFQRRWQGSEAPFDGQTVTLADLVPLTLLRSALAAVASILYERGSQSALFRLLDWHEHDGWLTEARLSEWDELRALIRSEEALLTCVADAFVSVAFFPEERDWYLRLYVPDHSDNPRHRYDDPNLIEYGILDLTGAESLVTEIVNALRAEGIANIEVAAAKTFFDNRAA